MKCPMCDRDRIHKLVKTFKGNLRYKCLACHAVFTDRPEVDRYPLQFNFLRYRDRIDTQSGVWSELGMAEDLAA
jgi:transposase-like protein